MDKVRRIDLIRLAARLPSLNNAPGIAPWSPNQLDIWGAQQADQNAVHSVRLLLHIWNPKNGWEVGPFDIFSATTDWDRKHRHAFLDWATQEKNVVPR